MDEPKAIEIIEEELPYQSNSSDADFADALKLAIFALKFLHDIKTILSGVKP